MAATKTFFEKIWHKKLTFLFVYFLVFLISYIVLVAIDFVPEPKTDEPVEVEEVTAQAQIAQVETIAPVADIPVAVVEELYEAPTEIYIERLDKTVEVLNPQSRTIADLDAALLDGVVRHPDSALLGQTGNVFILGHSSYLPNVFNENFQAFNGIENLEWGDIITVSSDNKVYTYKVEKVFQARAQEVTVPIDVDEKLLTIATCNSFGSIDDRYIVEARQIDVQALDA